MSEERRQHGFTLIEVALVVGLIGAIAGLAGALMSSWSADLRVKNHARSAADLLQLARTEAIRTSVNHLVFFVKDASDNDLKDLANNDVAALLVRDDNGDGAPQASEYVASVPFDAGGNVTWKSAHALMTGSEVPAPNDNPGAAFPLSASFVCCTFTQPGGAESRWVAFLPDGMPRAFSVGPFAAGNVTSGQGSVYATNGDRDYAVVLAPLGGVRVHAFVRGPRNWRQ